MGRAWRQNSFILHSAHYKLCLLYYRFSPTTQRQPPPDSPTTTYTYSNTHTKGGAGGERGWASQAATMPAQSDGVTLPGEPPPQQDHHVPATTMRPRGTHKRALVYVALAFVLVAGAIVAGVLGSRAAADKKRRRPIPIESVTYATATEGLLSATVLLSMPTSTLPAAQEEEQPQPSTLTEPTAPTSMLTQAYQNLKSLVGGGSPPPTPPPPSSKEAILLPAGAVAVPSWKAAKEAFGDQALAAHVGAAVANGRVLCYPTTGPELIEMASMEYNSPCDVLVLGNDKYAPYDIAHTINITRPKLLLGRPFRQPMLNATHAVVRLFDVLPGGRLETRSVTLVAGFGRWAGPEEDLQIQVGTLARVQVGAFFTATGCMLRERNNTRASFEDEVRMVVRHPNTRSRQFGQFILVLGGRLHLTGCTSFRFRPWGNGVLNAMVIGRDITVVAGYALLTGHFTYSGALWTSTYWVSGALGLAMGGVILFVGGHNVGANLLQLQLGWSCILGTYGGVLATIGWQYTSTNGKSQDTKHPPHTNTPQHTLTLSHTHTNTTPAILFRFNGGQFGGLAGVTYMTGFVQTGAGIVSVVFGPGAAYAQATGLYIWVGGAITSYAVSTAFFGVGGSTYVGAGSLIQIGIPQARTSLTTSSNGCGFYNFVGAGTLTHIYLPSYSVKLLGFDAGAGTDFFVGMGWANNINNTRFSLQLAASFFGVGNQAFVGLGGAVFIRSYSNSRRKYGYVWPTTFTYTVAGTGVSSSGVKGQSLVMTKGGVTRYVYNKTTKSITQISSPRAPKTASPTVLGGGKGKPGGKHGNVGTRRRKMTQTDGSTLMGSWLAAIADSTGGLDPSIANDNKVVVLQTTIIEGGWTPPHANNFKAPELKGRWGGYAKIVGDGLVDVDGDGGRRLVAKDDDGGLVGMRPGLISANNSACFLCSVGSGTSEEHVGGPGPFEVSEECSKAETPADVYAQAQGLTTTNIFPPAAAATGLPTNDEAAYPDTWLLWSELVVYCRSTDPDTDDASITDNCLAREYVEEVVKSYLAFNNSSTAAKDQGYQVTVAPSGLHAAAQLPNFAPDAQDTTVPALREAMAPAWNPDCQGWTTYDVQVTATDPKVEQHVLDVFEGFFADATDLEETVLANWDMTEDLQPCGIAITEKAEQRFPSIKTMPAYQPSETASIAPNVVVADATSIAPLRKLVPGETYKIYVQNFPAGSKVAVKLLEGMNVDGPVVASIPSFDDDGLAEMAWAAPTEVDVSVRKYYLQAQPVDFPALFAFSQLFAFKNVNVNAAEPANMWMLDAKNAA